MRISDWSSDVCSSDLDYHLKIDGIEGESLDEKHKGEIEIDSFSWGVTNMGGGGRGGGGGTGKAEFSDINFCKQADKSSPKLVKPAGEGEHIQEVVLTCRKASGKDHQVESLKNRTRTLLNSSNQCAYR